MKHSLKDIRKFLTQILTIPLHIYIKIMDSMGKYHAQISCCCLHGELQECNFCASSTIPGLSVMKLPFGQQCSCGKCLTCVHDELVGSLSQDLVVSHFFHLLSMTVLRGTSIVSCLPGKVNTPWRCNFSGQVYFKLEGTQD